MSVQATTFELLKLGFRHILTIARSSLNIKVIGSRSSSNVCLFSTKMYLKSQRNLKVKVKVTQSQGQVRGKCFCDLCAMRMVNL